MDTLLSIAQELAPANPLEPVFAVFAYIFAAFFFVYLVIFGPQPLFLGAYIPLPGCTLAITWLILKVVLVMILVKGVSRRGGNKTIWFIFGWLFPIIALIWASSTKCNKGDRMCLIK